MDSNNDVEFDAFWEEESRNKTRNRIRVGRQYQASVPPLLKPGESDNRRLEDLETLRWRPESLTDQSVQEYLSMAKAVSVFSRTLENGSYENLQSAIRGLTEFVMSHHPCHRDVGCRMAVKGSWTNKEAELLASALDRCENANRMSKKVAEEAEDSGSDVDDDDISEGEPPTPQATTEPPADVNPPSEIKPIPARVIGRRSDSHDGEASRSCQQEAGASHEGQAGQGSLKFYLGGQLILKLNANQEKKSWVEAPDNPVTSSQRRKSGGRKPHRTSTTSALIAWPERGSPSQESSSSIESHASTTTAPPAQGPLDLSSQQS